MTLVMRLQLSTYWSAACTGWCCAMPNTIQPRITEVAEVAWQLPAAAAVQVAQFAPETFNLI